MDSLNQTDLDELLQLQQAGPDDAPYIVPLEHHCTPAYLRTLKVMRNAWVGYNEKFAIAGFSADDSFAVMPTEQHLQAFLLYIVLTRKGKTGGRMCVSTLKKYFINFNKLVHSRLGRAIDRAVCKRITGFINQRLVEKGASLDAMARPTATAPVVIDLLYYLWACDEYEFPHPRARLQVFWAVLLLLYFGIRPGEIMEASTHPGSNEGIYYKDLCVMVVNDVNGRRRLAVEILLRNRKGARGKRIKDISMFLLEDFERPEMCPVAPLLALAMADRALQGVDTPDALRKIRAPTGQGITWIRIRESVKETPVIRRLVGHHQSVSPKGILKAQRLSEATKALGQRASYRDRFMPYSIRRGHGNLLDRFVSAAVRQKRMGHQNDSTFQHYISSSSTVDGQSMVLGREMEQGMLDRLASMATKVDFNAPKPRGASLTDVGRRNKNTESQIFQAVHRDYFDSDEAFSSSAAQPESDDGRAAADMDTGTRPPATRQFRAYLQWDPDRRNVIDKFYKGGSPRSLEDLIEPLLAIARPERSRWFYPNTATGSGCACYCGFVPTRLTDQLSDNRHRLSCYMSRRTSMLRDRMASDLAAKHPSCPWPTCAAVLSVSGLERAARHFAKHLSRDNRCFPSAGCREVTTSVADMHLHITRSHSIPLPGTLPQVRYCYDCREYFDNTLEWDQHCRQHLTEMDMFCGQIIRRYVVVMASRCPFCLGQESLPPGIRAAPFPVLNRFNEHLAQHLLGLEAGQGWPLPCPHPLCDHQIPSTLDFWDHCEKIHSIQPPAEKSADRDPVERWTTKRKATRRPTSEGPSSCGTSSGTDCSIDDKPALIRRTKRVRRATSKPMCYASVSGDTDPPADDSSPTPFFDGMTDAEYTQLFDGFVSLPSDTDPSAIDYSPTPFASRKGLSRRGSTPHMKEGEPCSERIGPRVAVVHSDDGMTDVEYTQLFDADTLWD